MKNLTITVPDESSNHGNSNLLCTPPKWYDFLIFYFANYVAHAATIITLPGEGLVSTVYGIALALFIPVSGVVRAVGSIRRHAATEKNLLRRAARARALCMVYADDTSARISGVRFATKLDSALQRANEAETRPPDSSFIHWRRISDEVTALPRPTEASDIQAVNDETGQPRGSRPEGKAEAVGCGEAWWYPEPTSTVRLTGDIAIHGQYKLPPGYYLVPVPRNAPIDFADPCNEEFQTALSSLHNGPKLLIGLGQAIWAAITLYRTRGDQIDRYGYAAFGLTVTPYAFMSVMNALGNLLNPTYPTAYLVRTPLMEQAEADGGSFTGEIRIHIVEDDMPPGRQPRAEDWFDMGLGLMCGLLPLVIVGALSHFLPQTSTPMQRGYTMSWLVVGILFGAVLGLPRLREPGRAHGSRIVFLASYLTIVIVMGLPAVGGMYVVGQMLNEFGICTLLQ